ncbi:MAG TPA: alanine/ornithine racemase family PLP-dependent enzyme [Firmicutes bacterium]|nr:alanine/ornithine racemase family PLP-dependent enzyme [Candidatus Fermentithermobacillaceae bacterium]
MKYPAVFIDLAKVRHNARVISNLLKEQGMSLVGVAKGTMCHPGVAESMLDGGARAIGDSRIGNLRRLRESGYRGETILLRAPSPSSCHEAVVYADVSLNSDPATVRMLGEAALKMGKRHKVILMVDLGDLREGVLAEDAPCVAKEMADLPGIDLIGIGTNLACYGGVIPTREKMEALLRVKYEIERSIGRPLERVSGGNSANMLMVLSGQMPPGVTELRIGESILLGTEAVGRTPIPGCFQDAFVIKAEVIEVLKKPSKPFGEIGQDAFGNVPVFEDMGIRTRAICAIGRQDIDPGSLFPLEKGVRILGASSDHLICDVEEAEPLPEPGSILEFRPGYGSLLRAFTSPFVEKVVI